MRRIGTITAVVCLALSIQASAQRHWQADIGAGFMAPTDFSNMDYSRSCASIELSWWQRPEAMADINTTLGVKFSFAAIPNSVAGQRIGVLGALRAPISRRCSRLEYEFGLGLSAFTRPYCYTGDPENIFIGPLINGLVDFLLIYDISETMQLSLALVHTSNGCLYLPNKGFNFFQLDWGIKFGGDCRYPLQQQPSATLLKSPHEVGFTLSPGLRESEYNPLDEYAFCYDVSLNYQYYTSSRFAVGVTLDFWYNFFDSRICQQDGRPVPTPVNIAVMAFMEKHWGPISLKAGIGPEIYTHGLTKIPYYERLGCYYNFGPHYVGLAVNAHAVKAEFVEWSYGYRFTIPSK